MAKVMLVIDDYTELVFTENLLKRMGFDVLTLNNDRTFNEAVLGFFPDLLITSFRGKSVDGLKLRDILKKKSPNNKVILAPTAAQLAGILEDTRSKFDGIAELPIQPAEMLKLIAQLLKQDTNIVLEKFEKLNKARAFSREDEVRVVKDDQSQEGTIIATVRSGGVRQESEPLSPREQRYQAFLATIANEPVDKVISHAEMSRAVAEQKRTSKVDEEQEKRLIEQKQEFVRALIKSKKP